MRLRLEAHLLVCRRGFLTGLVDRRFVVIRRDSAVKSKHPNHRRPLLRIRHLRRLCSAYCRRRRVNGSSPTQEKGFQLPCLTFFAWTEPRKTRSSDARAAVGVASDPSVSFWFTAANRLARAEATGSSVAARTALGVPRASSRGAVTGRAWTLRDRSPTPIAHPSKMAMKRIVLAQRAGVCEGKRWFGGQERQEHGQALVP